MRTIHKIAALSVCLAGAIAYITADNPSADSAGRRSEPGPDITLTEQAQLRYAEEILVRNCMRANGFDYFPTPPQEQPDNRPFPYVVDDVAWATRHGYGSDVQRDIERSETTGRNTRYVASLTETQKAAYAVAHMGSQREMLQVKLPTGQIVQTSTTSCLATARTLLYGDYPTWIGVSTLAQNLGPLVQPRVTADKRYAATMNAWAACMKRLGHPAESPQQLRESMADVPRQSEVDTAVTEATCAVETGLGTVAAELNEQYTIEVSKQWGDPVRHYRALRKAALPRAADIIRRA